MSYKCLRHANFGGVNYKKGDIIPTERVNPQRVIALERCGLIVEINDLPPAPDTQPPAAPPVLELPDAIDETPDAEPTADEQDVGEPDAEDEATADDLPDDTDESATADDPPAPPTDAPDTQPPAAPPVNAPKRGRGGARNGAKR